MKLFDFLHLKNISGQIAALVIASIIGIHLILTAIFLVSRPDQPDPTVDRGHAQFAAAVLLLGAAAAADRPRLFADIGRAFSLSVRTSHLVAALAVVGASVAFPLSLWSGFASPTSHTPLSARPTSSAAS